MTLVLLLVVWKKIMKQAHVQRCYRVVVLASSSPVMVLKVDVKSIIFEEKQLAISGGRETRKNRCN